MRCSRLLALLLLLPAPAFALDMDFYTYGGFQETVDAFTRLALVMSDSSFGGFAFTFAIAGVVLGGLFFAAKAHMGVANNPIGWLIPILFGICVFKGLVMPTGTLYIYDPVINANRAVGGVPDIVTLLAGGLNELERDVIQVVDAGSANPYGNNGGMMQFNLLMSSMGAQPDDVDVARSLAQYYTDCGTYAVGTNYNGVSLQELMRNSTDLFDTFAKFASPALFSTFYSAANDQGSTVTCQADWTSNLAPLLSSMPALQGMENEICGKAGFDPSQAAQLSACDSSLSAVPQLFGLSGSSALVFLRSVVLAQSITSAMQSGQYSLMQSQIMNRQVMVESLGSAEAMNEWIPKLRAFMTAVVIGLFPLCSLFLMTPLAWRALALVAGLFFWLFFWGISDAIASQMANDAATNAFSQIAHYNLGFDAIVNSPEAAIKALGIFGKARAMALTISTLLSGSLMAFGGLGLANLSEHWSRDTEGKGENAGRTAILPEQRGAFMQSMATGMANEAAIDSSGLLNVAGGQAQAAARSAGTFREMAVNTSLAGLSGGRSPIEMSRNMGHLDAGRMVGEYSGAKAAASGNSDSSVADTAATTGAFETTRRMSDTLSQKHAVEEKGMDAFLAGEIQGGASAGRLLALKEVYENLNGSDQFTAEGFRRLGRQLEGSTIGQTQATTTDQYIQERRVMAQKAYALAEAIDGSPGIAHFLGHTEALQSILQNRAFDDVFRTMGPASIESGYEFATAQSAASGEAAKSSGGIVSTARTIARPELAGRIAGAAVTANVARLLGRDPSNVSDIVFTKTAQGNYAAQVPLTPETKGEVIPKLQRLGLMSPSIAAYAMSADYNGVANVTMSAAGEALAADVVVGNRADVRRVSSVQVGESVNYFDTNSRDYSYRIRGGLAVLSKGNLEQTLEDAYGGTPLDGMPADYKFFALSSEIGNALTERGFSIQDLRYEQAIKDWNVGINTSAGAGTNGLRGPVSAEVGVSGGGRYAETYANNNSLSANGNTLLSAELIERARRQAIADVEGEHGSAFARDPANSSGINAEILSRQAQIVRERFDRIVASSASATAKARESNSVREKALDRN